MSGTPVVLGPGVLPVIWNTIRSYPELSGAIRSYPELSGAGYPELMMNSCGGGFGRSDGGVGRLLKCTP